MVACKGGVHEHEGVQEGVEGVVGVAGGVRVCVRGVRGVRAVLAVRGVQARRWARLVLIGEERLLRIELPQQRAQPPHVDGGGGGGRLGRAQVAHDLRRREAHGALPRRRLAEGRAALEVDEPPRGAIVQPERVGLQRAVREAARVYREHNVQHRLEDGLSHMVTASFT